MTGNDLAVAIPIALAILNLAGQTPWTVALLTGRLMTLGQHLRRVGDINEAHAKELATIREAHASQIAILEDRLTKSDAREQRALDAAQKERDRADVATEKLYHLGNTLGRTAVHLLESLPQTGDSGAQAIERGDDHAA